MIIYITTMKQCNILHTTCKEQILYHMCWINKYVWFVNGSDILWWYMHVYSTLSYFFHIQSFCRSEIFTAISHDYDWKRDIING